MLGPWGAGAAPAVPSRAVVIGDRRTSPEGRQCSHGRVWWDLAWSDRVVDATVPGSDPPPVLDPATVDLRLLASVGAHAWLVLDERAAAWPILEWALPIIRLAGLDLPPRPTGRQLQPLVDVAVGGALVWLRAALPDPPSTPDDREVAERIRGIVARGAVLALRRVVDEIGPDLREVGDVVSAQPAGRRRRRPTSTR